MRNDFQADRAAGTLQGTNTRMCKIQLHFVYLSRTIQNTIQLVKYTLIRSLCKE